MDFVQFIKFNRVYLVLKLLYVQSTRIFYMRNVSYGCERIKNWISFYLLLHPLTFTIRDIMIMNILEHSMDKKSVILYLIEIILNIILSKLWHFEL